MHNVWLGVVRVASILVVLISSGSLVLGQQPSQPAAASAPSLPGTVGATRSPGAPAIDEVGAISYRYGEDPNVGSIRIGIHRVTSIGSGATQIYTHRPTFFPMRNSEPIRHRGKLLSDLIWTVYPASQVPGAPAETVQQYVGVRFELSNEAIKRLVKEKIQTLDNEVDSVESGGGAVQTIEVLTWPVTSVSIRISFAPEYQVAASGQADVTRSDLSNGWFRVPVLISGMTLEEFSGRLEASEASIVIDYDYTGSDANKFLRFSQESTAELSDQIENMLNQEKIEPGGPVAQSELAKLNSRLASIVSAFVITNDPKLLDVIPPTVFSSLMSRFVSPSIEPLTPEKFQQQRNLDSLAGFLEPVFDELRTKEESYDETTNTNQSKVTVSGKVGGKEVWPSASVTKEDLQKTEKKFGVKFTEDSSTKEFALSEIDVSFRNDASATDVAATITTITVQAASTSVKSAREIVRASDAIEVGETGVEVVDDGSLLPVGSVVCSMLATELPPPGYIWITHQNKWPDEPWMGKLRGAQMPNTSGLFFAGTENVSEVGSVSAGRITLPPLTLTITDSESEAGLIRYGGVQRFLGIEREITKWPFLLATSAGSSDEDGATYTLEWCRDNRSPRNAEACERGGILNSKNRFAELSYWPPDSYRRFGKGRSLAPLLNLAYGTSPFITVKIPEQQSDYLKPDLNSPPNLKCRWMMRVQ